MGELESSGSASFQKRIVGRTLKVGEHKEAIGEGGFSSFSLLMTLTAAPRMRRSCSAALE